MSSAIGIGYLPPRIINPTHGNPDLTGLRRGRRADHQKVTIGAHVVRRDMAAPEAWGRPGSNACATSRLLSA
jgi:hypothetical protein